MDLHCMGRCGQNNVCVSRGLNNVCVSRGLKAQKYLAQGKRAIGAPCKGKSLRLLYTFALTGRSYICLPSTQGGASLALG